MSAKGNLRFVLTLSLTLVGCATASSGLSQKEESQFLIESAASSLAEGDATGALESLQQAVGLDAKNANIYFLYALAYHQKKQPKLALESAARSVNLNPQSSKFRNTYGKLLLDQRRYAEAEENLKIAAADLTNREAYLAKTSLGLLYQQTGKKDRALQSFSEAIEDEPYLSCLAMYYRGQMESDQGQLLKAQSDFTRSIQTGCGGLSDAHLDLGKNFVRLKKYDQARAKFMEINESFPHSEAAQSAQQLLKEIP